MYRWFSGTRRGTKAWSGVRSAITASTEQGAASTGVGNADIWATAHSEQPGSGCWLDPWACSICAAPTNSTSSTHTTATARRNVSKPRNLR